MMEHAKAYLGATAMAAVSAAVDWKSTLAVGFGSFAAWMAHASWARLIAKRDMTNIANEAARHVLEEHMRTCPAHTPAPKS